MQASRTTRLAPSMTEEGQGFARRVRDNLTVLEQIAAARGDLLDCEIEAAREGTVLIQAGIGAFLCSDSPRDLCG
jgi:hypothetical protein